jgi:hypothetical protein
MATDEIKLRLIGFFRYVLVATGQGINDSATMSVL